MEVIAVQPADMEGSIEGWYKSPADSSKPVILYFHGDGGSIGHRVGMVAPFIKAGYGVLLAEYRGYNGNEGEPTEQGLYADAEAYLDWLQNKRHIREGRVVIYGESLGTAVAVYLAANHANIGGVILDGSFTSLTALLQKQLIFFYAPLIFQDRFDALSRIRDIKSPILFLHGGRDNVTPLRMAKRLFDAANEPKTIKVFKDGAHLDLYNYGAADAVNEFMKSVR